MQNRYVGDIGDYVKLAILRQLFPGRRLGVAWWLFPDESHNADGGHREYLKLPDEWRRFDPDLFEALLKIDRDKNLDVRFLEDSALLPGTVFAREPVPFETRPFTKRSAERRKWLLDIQVRFADRDLLFLDPDNGIAADGLSPMRRYAGKSVLIGDIKELQKDHRAHRRLSSPDTSQRWT